MKGRYKSNTSVKKRSTNACERCRRQKIKCSATTPCFTCSKRDVACVYDDSTKKVLVTRKYLNDLLRRASSDNTNHPGESRQEQSGSAIDPSGSLSSNLSGAVDDEYTKDHSEPGGSSPDPCNGFASADTELVNPLATDSRNYITDYLGRKIHIGTTSNWAFSRRVLSTACERLGLQVPVEPIFFEESIYNLDWGVLSSGSPSCYEELVPCHDHAKYLIDAARFHCGQMFHLFDEEMFMRHFATFHASKDGRSKVPRLWYTHYLTLMALAKLLVARNIQSSTTPSCSKLFLEAMKSWPELIFGSTHVVECIEVLICAALYLQCLDFRSAAFKMIGEAVRKTLGQGLHTEISHRPSDGPIVQRCRRIWWTVYILDRQISALAGLPQAIKDEDISAPYPMFNTSKENISLEIHVKLSQSVAEIVNTVYGTDGREQQRFLRSTKQALENIAKTTELLKRHVEMPKNLGHGAISRYGAYLHLLNHQCICLTTRPLVLCYLDLQLQETTCDAEKAGTKRNDRALLEICIDSAHQMLNILSALKDEGILESFLPFDLEATFIASMILIMAEKIQEQPLEETSFWTKNAYSILDDMYARGNRIALARKHELQNLARILSSTNLPPAAEPWTGRASEKSLPSLGHEEHNALVVDVSDEVMFSGFIGSDGVAAEQLRGIADSLDFDSFQWMDNWFDYEIT